MGRASAAAVEGHEGGGNNQTSSPSDPSKSLSSSIVFQGLFKDLGRQAMAMEAILRVVCGKVDRLETWLTDVSFGMTELDLKLRNIAHNIEGTAANVDDDAASASRWAVPPEDDPAVTATVVKKVGPQRKHMRMSGMVANILDQLEVTSGAATTATTTTTTTMPSLAVAMGDGGSSGAGTTTAMTDGNGSETETTGGTKARARHKHHHSHHHQQHPPQQHRQSQQPHDDESKHDDDGHRHQALASNTSSSAENTPRCATPMVEAPKTPESKKPKTTKKKKRPAHDAQSDADQAKEAPQPRWQEPRPEEEGGRESSSESQGIDQPQPVDAAAVVLEAEKEPRTSNVLPPVITAAAVITNDDDHDQIDGSQRPRRDVSSVTAASPIAEEEPQPLPSARPAPLDHRERHDVAGVANRNLDTARDAVASSSEAQRESVPVEAPDLQAPTITAEGSGATESTSPIRRGVELSMPGQGADGSIPIQTSEIAIPTLAVTHTRTPTSESREETISVTGAPRTLDEPHEGHLGQIYADHSASRLDCTLSGEEMAETALIAIATPTPPVKIIAVNTLPPQTIEEAVVSSAQVSDNPVTITSADSSAVAMATPLRKASTKRLRKKTDGDSAIGCNSRQGSLAGRATWRAAAMRQASTKRRLQSQQSLSQTQQELPPVQPEGHQVGSEKSLTLPVTTLDESNPVQHSDRGGVEETSVANSTSKDDDKQGPTSLTAIVAESDENDDQFGELKETSEYEEEDEEDDEDEEEQEEDEEDEDSVSMSSDSESSVLDLGVISADGGSGVGKKKSSKMTRTLTALDKLKKANFLTPEEEAELKQRAHQKWFRLRDHIKDKHKKDVANILLKRKKNIFTVSNRIELLEDKSKEVFASIKQLGNEVKNKLDGTVFDGLRRHVNDLNVSLQVLDQRLASGNTPAMDRVKALTKDVEERHLTVVQQLLQNREHCDLHSSNTMKLIDEQWQHIVTIDVSIKERMRILSQEFDEKLSRLPNYGDALETIRRNLRKKADLKILKELEARLLGHDADSEDCLIRCLSCHKELVSLPQDAPMGDESAEPPSPHLKRFNPGQAASKVYRSNVPLSALPVSIPEHFIPSSAGATEEAANDVRTVSRLAAKGARKDDRPSPLSTIAVNASRLTAGLDRPISAPMLMPKKK